MTTSTYPTTITTAELIARVSALQATAEESPVTTEDEALDVLMAWSIDVGVQNDHATAAYVEALRQAHVDDHARPWPVR